MRWALLLFSFALAGCASTDDPFDTTPAASAAASASAASASAGTSAPSGSAVAEAPMTAQDRLNKVRGDCWMKVERVKTARTIDQRIAFVDKCVAEQSKLQ